MSKSPAIDQKRLLRDAVKAERDRPMPSVGRETIGIVQAIRDALPTIRDLRDQGVRWAAIAEALNAQGIYPDREGQPAILTASRLTAIVSKLEQVEMRKQNRTAQRQIRSGLVTAGTRKPPLKPVGLSSELQPARKEADATPSFETEEDLRRRALSDIQPFLKDRP